MAMQAGIFFAHLNQIKQYIQKYPDAADEIKTAFADLATAFKGEFSPAEFKQALGEGRDVSSDLEERTTSILMLIKQDRTHRTSG